MSLVLTSGLAVKNPPAMQETQVQSLGWEEPLEKEMATHSSILAWEIPQTEEPGRVQSMGLKWVGHDWVIYLDFRFFWIQQILVSEEESPVSIQPASNREYRSWIDIIWFLYVSKDTRPSKPVYTMRRRRDFLVAKDQYSQINLTKQNSFVFSH